MSNFTTLKRLLPVQAKRFAKRLLSDPFAQPEQITTGDKELRDVPTAVVDVPTAVVDLLAAELPAEVEPAKVVPAIMLPALAMSFAALRNMIANYDLQPLAARNQMSADAFLYVSLYPQTAHFLGTEFCLRSFNHHNFAQQLIAAYHLGMGYADKAHALLADIDHRMPSSFNAIMAARCFMRPPGREADAEAYLQKRATEFPDDVPLIGNLATAKFVQGKTAAANETLAPVLHELRSRLGHLDAEHTDLLVELNTAIADKDCNRITPYDNTAYAEAAIWQHWEPYYDEMIQESPFLYFGWYRKFFRENLVNISAGVDQVINFGVMCGLPDFEAAISCPGVNFFGIDRQERTKEHNDRAFKAGNLHFVGSEIEPFIEALPDGPKRALFHARTATLCYPDKIKRLYKLCARANIRTIMVFENVAMGHQHYKFMDFDEFDEDAIIFKSAQFIHNYPKFLREAGYKVTREQRLFSPSITPFPDIEIGSVHVLLTAELE